MAIPDSRLASGSQNRLLRSEGAIWKARIVSQLSQTGIVESAPISVLQLDGKPVDAVKYRYLPVPELGPGHEFCRGTQAREIALTHLILVGVEERERTGKLLR